MDPPKGIKRNKSNLKFWNPGILEFWNSGIWNPGILELEDEE
jgi:hypothetical protein